MTAITVASIMEAIEIIRIHLDSAEVYNFAREYLIIISEIK
jgi:hypothetical protein